MKIYKVVVAHIDRDETHLIRAESMAAARNHVYRIVSTRVANQDDMMLAVGEGALEIEDAAVEAS